ncbi:MAG: uroporphyrinogen-III decarboxylase-like protein [Candidatus Aminicenantes bacterium]|nr:uroporphyrinogen-III decarboxylase-like protein [Candidatus Aminicenantes bacterium]
MIKEAMTPKERWQAVFERRKPDRLPMDYWGTEEATSALMRHLGCGSKEEALRKLHVDYVVKVAPRYIGPKLAADEDVFGRKFRDIDYGSGVYRECIHNPLAGFKSVEEIERCYAWPNPDWWDYRVIPGQIRGQEMYPIQGGGSEPFLIYKELRGDEQSLIDFIENPEIAHYLLDKLFSLAYEDTRRIFEQAPGKILLAYVAEDMGGQTDLLFSPTHIREFLLPGMKRIIDLAHEAGAYVFHHNDGACRRIIPDMIGLGIDLLNPIQWRCAGMEREGLKRDFADKIVFHGGMDNQQTLPFGTAEDVRREVLDNIRILGAGGGYILAPCHNIQPNTPPENVVAMYETGFAEGRDI